MFRAILGGGDGLGSTMDGSSNSIVLFSPVVKHTDSKHERLGCVVWPAMHQKTFVIVQAESRNPLFALFIRHHSVSYREYIQRL